MSPGKTPEAQRARNTLWTAIWRGDVERPSTCGDCGRKRDTHQIHAHHDDYSEPLKVRWLCARCHTLHHQAITTPAKRRSYAPRKPDHPDCVLIDQLGARALIEAFDVTESAVRKWRKRGMAWRYRNHLPRLAAERGITLAPEYLARVAALALPRKRRAAP